MLGASWSMDIAGPMARTAEDCAITLQAIAGYDARDPYTARQPVPDYRAALHGPVRGLRIGLVQEAIHADFLNPQVQAAVSTAVSHLASLGAIIVDVSIPL